MQNVVKLAHSITALHDPWCHFISGLWWVSLAEYLLVLRVLFPTCYRLWSIIATARFGGSCCNGEVWSWAWSFWVIFSLMLLLEVNLGTGMYLKSEKCWFQITLLPLPFNLSCNNYVELRCILNYLWNGCNMWLVMLNHYDLGLYVGWFEMPRDFIGLPELYGLKCENLITSVIIFVLVFL
jgi:hypothetical protein